jgi:hypothetical protein
MRSDGEAAERPADHVADAAAEHEQQQDGLLSESPVATLR